MNEEDKEQLKKAIKRTRLIQMEQNKNHCCFCFKKFTENDSVLTRCGCCDAQMHSHCAYVLDNVITCNLCFYLVKF